MLVNNTLLTLELDEVLDSLESGAALIDLRKTDAYLEVHIPGSLGLLYEFGPGMPTRARDCIPLDVPLVLLDLGEGDMVNAAATLRGKGFTVLGKLDDGINRWADKKGPPASTDVVTGSNPPEGRILDVADPGARAPEGSMRIPCERLWTRAGEVAREPRVVVASGYGVRAALAVGMLERAGAPEILFWKTAA